MNINIYLFNKIFKGLFIIISEAFVMVYIPKHKDDTASVDNQLELVAGKLATLAIEKLFLYYDPEGAYFPLRGLYTIVSRKMGGSDIKKTKKRLQALEKIRAKYNANKRNDGGLFFLASEQFLNSLVGSLQEEDYTDEVIGGDDDADKDPEEEEKTILDRDYD